MWRTCQQTCKYTAHQTYDGVVLTSRFRCGTWPAFWFVGTGVWPETGEIDIIEQTNNQASNVMSLHSSAEPNCTIAGVGQSGQLLTPDCAVRQIQEQRLRINNH